MAVNRPRDPTLHCPVARALASGREEGGAREPPAAALQPPAPKRRPCAPLEALPTVARPRTSPTLGSPTRLATMAQAAAGDSRAGEGVRMRRLRDTLSKALDECFRTVELSTFHQALPTIARKHQAAVDELGIGVLDTLRKNVEVRAPQQRCWDGKTAPVATAHDDLHAIGCRAPPRDCGRRRSSRRFARPLTWLPS